MAETIEVRNMRLVNPTGTSLSSSDFRLNERSDSLSGKTLGLLENSKANSDKVLHELGQMLKEKYDLKDVVWFNKHSASLPTSDPPPASMVSHPQPPGGSISSFAST